MPSPVLDFRNANSLWGSVLAETLARLGVRHAVVAPGSRSTSLAIAFATQPAIEAIPVLDERSAGYFALGLSKRSHLPTVLVCTSGTAAANFFPAIIEARESGVPLIVITADRPPEMRECSSGQTIDQQKIYGVYPRWQHEMMVPRASLKALEYLRQTTVFAFERSQWPQPGPVHLNAPFRDPLPPVPDGVAEKLKGACDWDRFFGCVQAQAATVATTAVPNFPDDARGIIVVGAVQPSDAAGFADRVGEISRKLGWPVLTDALSPLRHHSSSQPSLVSGYEFIIRNESFAKQLRPSHVLCLGGYPISRFLRAWLKEADAETWVVSESDRSGDPLHGRTRHLRMSLRDLASQIPQSTGANRFERLWAWCEKAVRGAIDEKVPAIAELFEGRALWTLAARLPQGTPLFIANSMPVRDADYYWPPGDRKAAPFFNRGASGIDGTLSTALGVAHGGNPAVLLTGDLALLHDTNGFLIGPKLRGSLTIVLINNRGGGIFGHMTVAQFEPPFEEFFATPQEADFGKLCAAYGVEHVPVRDWEHFAGLIANLPAGGVRVLEIRCDRKRDAATRQSLFEEIPEALSKA